MRKKAQGLAWAIKGGQTGSVWAARQKNRAASAVFRVIGIHGEFLLNFFCEIPCKHIIRVIKINSLNIDVLVISLLSSLFYICQAFGLDCFLIHKFRLDLIYL